MAFLKCPLQVLIKHEIQRKSGYAIQANEEQLRVQLDTIQGELNSPTQFKGRLNELMSQIRMQNHFGAVKSEKKYYIDADLLREIKQVSVSSQPCIHPGMTCSAAEILMRIHENVE